ncbi:MAG TPA: nucleoside permease [Chitinophagaceae bacterium]|nr:nucleoside permease [Chitinophagaceae bacterium]
MGIKFRLTILNFLQFFIWGSWLISVAPYMFSLGFNSIQVGSVFTTMGIASLVMPALLGIVADRWVNAERVLGMCHIAGAAFLLWASSVKDFPTFYLAMLLNSFVFMPTIALANTVSYITLEKNNYDIVKVFPPIRVWGTIGFIVAMWVVNMFHWITTPYQFYLAAGAAITMGIYSFTVSKCPPAKTGEKKSLASSLGLDAFVLFKKTKMAIFFIFSMFLGAALQITNAFGGQFLADFNTKYPDSFAVKNPNILLSISQISETLFILTIPFFLRRFGIKKVMLMSIFAWVFRFGLFGIGNPADGLYLLIISMIVYGMAFDFFNISGSLFVEREADIKIRASAQGLFMLMTNGLGATFGGMGAGWVVDHFTNNGIRDWQSIWFCFAGYALALGLIFPLVFKYKHDPTMDVKHGH